MHVSNVLMIASIEIERYLLEYIYVPFPKSRDGLNYTAKILFIIKTKIRTK